jgi:acetylornithine deacetylase/succinyl-diaminopimelate desuccinylase-like protein
MKKALFLLAAICVVAFTACSSSGSSDSSKGVVKEYLESVKAGKFEKAVTFFYFKEETSQAEMKALAAKLEEGYSQDGGLERYEIISEEILKAETEGGVDRGKVVVKLYYKDGNEEEETITTVKHNGVWKIDFSVKQ